MGYKTKNSATLVTNFGKMEKEIVSKRKVKKKIKISRLDEPEPSVQSMHAEPGQCKYNMYLSELVGNKAKGRISEWVFQENSTSDFSKNEHFLHLDTHTYVFRG